MYNIHLHHIDCGRINVTMYIELVGPAELSLRDLIA